MTRAAYRFFDAGFVLESDSAAFAAGFDRAYAGFKLASHVPDDDARLPVYRVSLSGRPSLTIGGETWRSADPEALELYAYNAILNAMAARVRSHFLFHAAALATPAAPDGSGIILAGGSGLGKTTLAAALLGRGWAFLSDDVAAVGRADGHLYPFPRRLRVRFPGGRPGEKQWLDVEDVAPGSLRATASQPARCLFLLAEAARGPGGTNATWYLLLERLEAGLLAGLRAAAGVQAVGVARGEPYPALRVELAPDAWPAVEPEIQAICRRHDVLLFEITRGPEDAPDFGVTPELIPIPPAEAARELLGHLKGGPRSALLHEEFGGSATRLYLALTELAAGMACYRLRVGRLTEMVEAIAAATAADDPHGGSCRREAA